MSRFTDLLQTLRDRAPQSCIEAQGQSHTYAELLDEIERWQLRFDQLNLAAGTVVGVCTDYSFSAVAALFALFRRDGIAALIPRDRNPDEYASDAHASALLTLDRDGNYQWRCLPQPPSHPLLERLRAGHEGGVVIFTSGSTGRPKAALQSLEGLLRKFQKPGRSLRTLAFLLFDHIAGLDTLLYTLRNGGTLILAQHRDPEHIVSLIESHRVEVLPTSPSFLRMLCLARFTRTHDLSSIKVITYGSEPMDANTLSRINALFPNAQISQKYGTTETGSPRTVSRGNDSLWLKFTANDVETKIVDGVLWIRSQGSLLGYLNATSPLDEQGWYCTGDLVESDGEWIRFSGRLSDVINVGGEKVTPTEVERTILELDLVSRALVSGERHALMGEIVTAKVALTDPSIDPAEAVKRIRRHCREHLAPHKVPMKIRVVTETFENERQKVQRRSPE